MNPGKCERCKHAYHSDGKPMEIHWSLRLQAWTCLRCYFEVPQVYP